MAEERGTKHKELACGVAPPLHHPPIGYSHSTTDGSACTHHQSFNQPQGERIACWLLFLFGQLLAGLG